MFSGGVLADTPGVAIGLLRMLIDRVRDSDQHRVEFGARDTLGRVAAPARGARRDRGRGGRGRRKDRDPAHAGRSGRVDRRLEGSRGPRARGRCETVFLIRTGRKEIIILDLDGLRDAAR